MNPYILDSFKFFQIASSQIEETIEEMDVVESILNFSLGMERLLKGILYSINPLYILISPDFTHSIQVIYGDKILGNEENKKVLEKKPTSDVITFRNSLLRASVVSRSTQKNKSRLFSLSNSRDIIAHHELSKLDLEKSRMLLQRDFYFLLMDYADELNIEHELLFSNNIERLVSISKNHQTDIGNIIRLKLDEHRLNWKKKKNNIEETKKADAVTNELLETEHRYETTCPACNQKAVLYAEPEYVFDTQREEQLIAGEFATKIKCEYCNLEINEDLELDELGYGKSFDPQFDDDIPF